MVAGSAGLVGEAIEYAAVALHGSGEALLECVVGVAGGLGGSIVRVAADPSVSIVSVAGRWGHERTVGQRQVRDRPISGRGAVRVALRSCLGGDVAGTLASRLLTLRSLSRCLADRLLIVAAAASDENICHTPPLLWPT